MTTETKPICSAAQFLKNLSNPHRLMVLCLLTNGEMCVTEMLKSVDISQTALSQHLSRLRKEGLVDFRRDHRTLYYFIKSTHVHTIIHALYEMFCGTEK